MSPQMFFFPPGSPFSHWLSPVLLHELQEAKQSACSFPPERLSQLPRLKWALRPSRRPPPTRRSSPSRSGSLASARLASPRSPRFKHRCHGVESCCLPLQHMCDFALCVSVCIHVCQPPDAGGGIKDALSPPEAAEPQHICDWSIILLQLYLFSSSSSSLFHHVLIPVTQSHIFLALLLCFFFIISRPFLSSSLCSRYLFSSRSSLPSVSQRFAFCVRYPYHNPLVSPPFFFFFISLSFIPSIRTIFASLYIYCHTEGKISEAEMIYVWYKLSIEPHWFSA